MQSEPEQSGVMRRHGPKSGHAWKKKGDKTMNEKIIAREMPPEWTDFSFYFDDDCFSRSSGELTNELYILQNDRFSHWHGFNAGEYEEWVNEAESLIEAYSEGDGIGNKWDQCPSVGRMLRDMGIVESVHAGKAIKRWKEWLARTSGISDIDDMAEYLTIRTGKKWGTKYFTGYSQGDYCTVLYCPDAYKNGVEEIGKLWLGCGSEFVIDDCGGYFVVDTVRWHEGDELRMALAESYGCEPAELEIYLYTGAHTVAEYELMAT